MDYLTPTTTKVLLAVCGIASAVPSLFFSYHTIRLIYLNLTIENAAAYRSGEMLIGAIVFPVAAIVFGLISWWFTSRSRRGSKED